MFRPLLLGVLCVLCVESQRMTAQDRMPPLPVDKLSDAQKKAIDEFKAVRGADISGPFVPLLRSPEVMTRARAMGDYLRFKSALPPRLSEFVILLTAREWSQQYEWDVHSRDALEAGIAPDTVQAIADGRRPSSLTEDEAILYDFCLELQRTRGVSDAVYNRALARF